MAAGQQSARRAQHKLVAYAGTNALLDHAYVGWTGGELLALADEPVWHQAYWAGVWWRHQHWSLELVSFRSQDGRIEVFRDLQGEYLENITDAIAFLVSGQALVLGRQPVPLPVGWAAPGLGAPAQGRAVSRDRLLGHFSRVEHPHTLLVLWSHGDWGLAAFGCATLVQVQGRLLDELEAQDALLLCSGAPAGLCYEGRRYPEPGTTAEGTLRAFLTIQAPASQPLDPELKLLSLAASSLGWPGGAGTFGRGSKGPARRRPRRYAGGP